METAAKLQQTITDWRHRFPAPQVITTHANDKLCSTFKFLSSNYKSPRNTWGCSGWQLATGKMLGHHLIRLLLADSHDLRVTRCVWPASWLWHEEGNFGWRLITTVETPFDVSFWLPEACVCTLVLGTAHMFGHCWMRDQWWSVTASHLQLCWTCAVVALWYKSRYKTSCRKAN